MKTFKKNITKAVGLMLVGIGLNSCSLELTPLNDVVLENYWTDKADVESVVTSCYVGMQENDYVSKMIIWGEDRSDNTMVVSGYGIPTELRSMMLGSLKTTNNTCCNWFAMYNVINRCNTVLQYAPTVAEKDPNYTTSELNANIAECKALRAISYLTLIKTFGRVPFTFEASIDDNVNYNLPQTSFATVLDALIEDLEECKNYAPKKFTDPILNSGKITRNAMYAILAELYLWRASDHDLDPGMQNEFYAKCVECCDYVISSKIEQYTTNDFTGTNLPDVIDEEVLNDYGIPLLAEVKSTSAQGGGNASKSIFYNGNSFESIFEITYDYGSERKSNFDILNMYGGRNSSGTQVQYVGGSEYLMQTVPNTNTYDDRDLFVVNTDFRSLLSFKYAESGTMDISKYVKSVTAEYNGEGTISESLFKNPKEASYSSRLYTSGANWIIYRLTEILLFRAEAEIEMAGNLDKQAAAEDTTTNQSANARRQYVYVDGSTLDRNAKSLYDDAFNLIVAVNKRSNPASKKIATVLPDRTKYSTLEEFEKLLMNERRREFLFEGKRYFDLVRQARREGNMNKFTSALSSKYKEGGAAIAQKMKNMDFLYMPVLKNQMKVNPNLTQNSAYLDEEDTQKN